MIKLKDRDQICPLCNGLYGQNQACPSCNRNMEDIGKMEDYIGAYTPYMDNLFFTVDNKGLMIGDGMCIHLYYCENCKHIHHYSIAYL